MSRCNKDADDGLAIPPAPLEATQPGTPPLLIDSVAGADVYLAYCASCHGRDGRGGGPVAPALAIPPPDLTTLATRAGGAYPFDRVLSSITGEPQPSPVSHGSSDMRVWGPVFRALDRDPATARVRVDNLVAYLESIQRP